VTDLRGRLGPLRGTWISGVALTAMMSCEPGALVWALLWNWTGRLASVGEGGMAVKRADMVTMRRPVGESRRRRLTRVWRRCVGGRVFMTWIVMM
jgi:hypothetical protein